MKIVVPLEKKIEMLKVKSLIERILIKNDWSQKQLAEELGVSSSQMSKWNRPNEYISEARKKQLFALLDMEPDTIITPAPISLENQIELQFKTLEKELRSLKDNIRKLKASSEAS